MKKFACLFFLLANSVCSFGQQASRIDSLKMKLEAAVNDTVKVALYNELAWEYSFTDFDSAEQYTEKALQMAAKVKDPYWQAVSFEMKAILYELSGRQEEAIQTYLQVIDLREKAGGEGVENTYNNIAILFKNQKNHEKALGYFRKSFDIESKNKNERGVVASLNNMAISLKDLGRNDSAFLLIKEAYARAQKADDGEYWVYSSVNLAKHFVTEGNSDSVLFYTRNVIETARRLELQGALATILQMMANVYIDKRQYDVALRYLIEAEQLAAQINTLEFLRSNYHAQARAYEGLKDYQKAFGYLGKYVMINDSIINQHTIEVLNDLEKKYETATKDRNIAELNEQNTRNELKAIRQANLARNVLYSSGIFVLMALLVLFALYQQLRSQKLLTKKNEEIKAVEFKRQAAELEMKALRAQMNPHFIFNCMNSINKMILNGENEEASRYLTKFSRLIRLTLENSDSRSIPLEDELSILEAYIQLESVRFKGRIHYEISVDPSLETSAILIPSMILQPFVENAIWHGLMHKEETGHIKISVSEADEELKFIIEDDGIGREMAQKLEKQTPEKSRSMGLKITEERLKLIKKGPKREAVKIEDLRNSSGKPLGTKVEINIPVN